MSKCMKGVIAAMAILFATTAMASSHRDWPTIPLKNGSHSGKKVSVLRHGSTLPTRK